jgi:hypothetical protein
LLVRERVDVAQEFATGEKVPLHSYAPKFRVKLLLHLSGRLLREADQGSQSAPARDRLVRDLIPTAFISDRRAPSRGFDAIAMPKVG